MAQIVARARTADGNVGRTEFEMNEDIFFDAWVYSGGTPKAVIGTITFRYRDPNGTAVSQAMTAVSGDTGHYVYESQGVFTLAGEYQATITSTNPFGEISMAFSLRRMAVP
jgi:hypothetical protein